MPKASDYSTVVVKIKVPQEDIRSFRDPNGLGRKWYMCQIPVEEINKAKIDFGPNPRDQNTGTKVYEGIRNTLENKPSWFLYYSKGIVVNADEASYDNRTETLTIRLRRNDEEPWSSLGGNADGGHLQRAIFEEFANHAERDPSEKSEQAYVKLEVLTGIPTEELDDLVGARNTNLQVSELSLAVLGDELTWLIDILERKGVNKDIAWRQFEEGKTLEGKEVIGWLSLINPEMGEKERVRCYSGVGYLIRDLRHNKKLMAGLKSTASIAFEWLRFIDYLHSSFEKWYGQTVDESRRSGFGNLKGVSIRPEGYKLVFLNEEIRYCICKPWLVTIAGAFAQLARTESPEEWRAIADIVGPTLITRIIEFTRNEHNNLNAVGKRSFVWGTLASEVKSSHMGRVVERLSRR